MLSRAVTEFDDTQRSSNTDALRSEMNQAQLRYSVAPFPVATSRGGARIPTNAPGGEINVKASEYVQRCAARRDCAGRKDLKEAASRSAEGVPGGYGKAMYADSFTRPKSALTRDVNLGTLKRLDLFPHFEQQAQEALALHTPAQVAHKGYGPSLPKSERAERYVTA